MESHVPMIGRDGERGRLSTFVTSAEGQTLVRTRAPLPPPVSSHLYRAFPKLGITSRAALRDALGKLSGEQGA
ncbi:hypothetical protein [Streptomyces canus]|uniref:hypothetical protein n=1 Tax=Streptomyces canus TaxID=58343 RepID=UPI003CF03578